MHEISLNQVISDYLTGEDIELTTYEDIRQALARILVEEKGYPPESIVPKYRLSLDLGDKHYDIVIDFVVYIDKKPAFILGFCPGAVSTFITQYVCVARLFPGGPVPYAAITDFRDVALMRVQDKSELCRGYHCIPDWTGLKKMFSDFQGFTLSSERLNKEKRIAYAMFALSDGSCSSICQITTDKS